MPGLRRLMFRLGNLWGPQPLNEFADYDDYWKRRGQIKHIFYRWIITAQNLPDEGTLLDVGCGSAEFLTYLHEHKPKLKLAGNDISEQSVEMTRRAGFDADCVNLVEKDLDGKYDYITCLEVLEHIHDAEVVLRKMRDACRKQLFVSVPNVGFIGCRIRLGLFGRFPTTSCVMHVKEHIRFWTVRDFRQWAQHNDLRIVKIYGVKGVKWTPSRLWPALWASGVLYVLEPMRKNESN